MSAFPEETPSSARSRDDALVDLIRLAQEATELDGGDTAIPVRSDTGRSRCLSFARLESIAAPGGVVDGDEARHLRSCSRCRHRFRAFGAPVPAAGVSTPAPGFPAGRRRWVGFVAGLSAVGLAAALLLALRWEGEGPAENGSGGVSELASAVDRNPGAPLPLPGNRRRSPRSAGPEESRESPVVILYSPAELDDGVQRVDRFQLVAERACAVLPILRTWGPDCDCTSWRFHAWDDVAGRGATPRTLVAGELVAIDLDVSEAPPIPQLLVILTADRAEALPEDPEAAQALLSCLEIQFPPACVDDPDDGLAAVPACVGDGIAVQGASFVVRR